MQPHNCLSSASTTVVFMCVLAVVHAGLPPLTCQVDLVEIKTAFLEKYHKTLYKMIEGDTSGDYRRLLLAVVGRN